MAARLALAGVLLPWTLLLPPATASDAPQEAVLSLASGSADLRRLATFPRKPDSRPIIQRGGTELAFDGRYVFAAEQGKDGVGGGLQVIDTAGRLPRVVGSLSCGGWQNDVAVVRTGLLALGYHAGSRNCGHGSGGVTLVDVSSPSRPRVLGSTREAIGASDVPAGLSGVHTITPYPGTSLLYASPGGRQTLTGSIETVVDVSDPRRPRVAGTFETSIGCHDLTLDIRPGRKLGFCSGIGETQVWDVSNPLAPTTLAHIVNPLHPFQHSAAVSSDGNALVIGTETVANDCAGGPTGALVVYDITDPRTPVLASWYGAQRGAAPVYTHGTDPGFDQLCAPHQFNLIPGTRIVVSGNGSGGVNLVDFSDPRAPREIGYFTAPDRDYFAAYWFDGRVYANAVQGVDVFAVSVASKRPPAPRPAPPRRSLADLLSSSDGATACFVRTGAPAAPVRAAAPTSTR